MPISKVSASLGLKLRKLFAKKSWKTNLMDPQEIGDLNFGHLPVSKLLSELTRLSGLRASLTIAFQSCVLTLSWLV